MGVGSLSHLYPPNPGIEPRFPALQADSLPAEPLGKRGEKFMYKWAWAVQTHVAQGFPVFAFLCLTYLT